MLKPTLLLFCALAAASPHAAIDWPQEITADEGTIVVYQPQPESLDGNVLEGRAAMSLEHNDESDPIFGAFWFAAKIDTDNDAGTAMIHDVKVTNVRWPDSKDAGEQRFTSLIESNIPQAGFEISLERLSASLETAKVERRSLEELKSDPPVIEFSDTLAVLLLYDGEPRFSAVEDSSYERAMNTPFAVVRDTRSKRSYLSSGALWYQADDPLGPWSVTQSPPSDLTRMMPTPEDEDPAPTPPPGIVVATKPTELISTDGKADWQSLPGGDMLYVTNTETPWLRELSTNNMYVLLSGRWYRAKSQSGPWTFVPADELPPAFKDIPPDSDIGGLRSSVAGTDEAEDAVLDSQIPQTAAIKRSEAELDVSYDGDPKFEAIAGTKVAYAVNTGAQVLRIDNRYYAVDDGVWFSASSAGGPWAVADEIPKEEIDKIPPSSPVYNTTYVNIYDSTPDIVYVGYTPGYMWSFPYYGAPVYGTGWYYPPYWGSMFYPRPPTWGMHVGYNPWTGWNFGVSWSNGFFNMGVTWGGGYHGGYRPGGCCGGWYGGGYRRPVVVNTGDINIGNTVNIGNRNNIGNRIGRNEVNLDRSRTNLYNRSGNRNRLAPPGEARRSLEQARPASSRANDVFADRGGNVARRADSGWETRQNGQWEQQAAQARESVSARATPETRERASSAWQSRDLDRAGLDRANMARQRGAARERGGMQARAGGMGGMRRR